MNPQPSPADAVNITDLPQTSTSWAIISTLVGVVSIVSTTIVIGIVTYFCRRKGYMQNPVFRLAGSVALTDLILAISGMLLLWLLPHLEHYDILIRVCGWFIGTSFFVFNTSTMCIALHIHLTVLANRHHWAKRLYLWYEVIIWSVGLIITSPIIYITSENRWTMIHYLDNESTGRAVMFALFIVLYVWNSLCIIYCGVISVMTFCRLLPSYCNTTSTNTSTLSIKSENYSPFSPPLDQRPATITSLDGTISDYSINAPVAAKLQRQVAVVAPVMEHSKPPRPRSFTPVKPTSYCTARHRRKIRYALHRIILYPLIPVIVQTITFAFIAKHDSPKSLGNIVIFSLMAQGILNSSLFIFYPGLDPFWSHLKATVLKSMSQLPIRCSHRRIMSWKTRSIQLSDVARWQHSEEKYLLELETSSTDSRIVSQLPNRPSYYLSKSKSGVDLEHSPTSVAASPISSFGLHLSQEKYKSIKFNSCTSQLLHLIT